MGFGKLSSTPSPQISRSTPLGLPITFNASTLFIIIIIIIIIIITIIIITNNNNNNYNCTSKAISIKHLKSTYKEVFGGMINLIFARECWGN